MLKCPNCGTETTTKGVAFVSQKALNTHINFHCTKKNPAGSGGVANTGKTHTHKFVLLNPKNGRYGNMLFDLSAVHAAIREGNSKVCVECGDVE